MLTVHPRLLRTFLAVARSCNVTRAAAELHLAQSSVSDQLQTLETELRASLFTRSRQGLELTSAGRTLQGYAEEVLALLNEARDAVEADAGLKAGSLTIGALESIAAARLPRVLAAFQGDHPDVTLRVKVMGSGGLLRDLEDAAIDVAFCFDRGGVDERLAKRTLSKEPLVLIAPPDGRFVSMAGGLTAVAAAGFVVTETGCIYRRLFDEAFAAAGIAAKVVAELGSVQAIARMVAAGMGLALVPRLAVVDALDRGEIVELPWPGPVHAASLAMIWRRRRVQPPALKLFLAAMDDAPAPVRSADVRPRHAVSSRS